MASTLVTPGQPITSEAGFLRGHGTYFVESLTEAANNVLTASVSGEIERVNRLISVRPARSRYIGEVGDLVVGRISGVESKRWKVDLGGHRDAVLQLSAVTLPGGEQRLRTYEDQLQMRSLFQENDLICAEVQMISSDGLLHLHTRSLKYGHLENGQLIEVGAQLIKRLPQHHISLPCGMDMVLGRNGKIWIARTMPEQWQREAGIEVNAVNPVAEALEKLRKKHRETPLTRNERLTAARVYNSIRCVAKAGKIVTPEKVMTVHQRSLSLAPKEMLIENNWEALTSAL